MTIINCTFTDNQASYGGAIYGDNVKMSIYGCTFIDNYASSNGGAIAVVGEAPDDYEIFNCTFIGNVANGEGGAFYSHAEQDMGNIINSTFINNRASAGDVVYNYGYEGTIDRCVFINNTANSMIYGSYAEMIISNSIIVNNYGDNLVSVETVIMDYNWWGTTADDEDAPVISGNTLTNYYILNMTADDDSADITLNNLYDNGVITTSYANYALPSINLTVKGKNVEVADSVVLGTDGEATIEHAPAGEYEITIEYNGVVLTREIKPSFKWLNDKINSEGSEVSLDPDCTYDSAKDHTLTNGIEFAKDMVIDGHGHVINAKESSNIFYFDDDTNSYSLTLKNIIFANAVGANGAAVYFKGNQLKIINCTFINNKADSEGDAVYVAHAISKENMITKSLFAENAGSNSVICINLDSNAYLKVDNSIFIGNNASKNIIATGNVNADYNWWGNTNENNADISKTEGVNVTKWLFLKIDAVAAITGDAILSLNNLYDGGQIGTYSEYALKPLTFALGGFNASVSVSKITLGDDGRASYQFRMDRATATLTAGNDDVTTSALLEYHIVDDGSFRALNEIIFFSDDGAVIELTHDYVYGENDTITEGIVIPRKITINGNGHTIDAKGKTRIFHVPEGVSNVAINNINFINAKASYGSVIVINKDSNYFNMSNCNFTDNVATDYGGVIDCVGDYCTIENCNFINNNAVSKAGVIRYYHDNLAYIKNSNFINNRVADGSSGGGVIYVDDGAVAIDKSVFIGNVANDKPGSVLYTPKSATVTNSIFLNNPGAYSIYGGSGVELTNNWFGNTSSDYDLMVNNTVSVVYPETTLNNWLYLDIKFLDNQAIVSLNNAYDKSSASTGVISNYNLPELTLNINSTTLGLNTDKVTLDASGKAGTYYTKLSDDAKLTVSNEYVSLTSDVCDFDILQGLIDEYDEIELSRDYVYSIGDSITEGIAIGKSIVIDGKGHIIDANQQSRIFKIIAGNVTLKNINFINGHADFAGAIWCENSNLTIIGCNFSDNDAYEDISYGGAVVFNGDKLTVDNSRFISNKAKYGGAVIIENAADAKLMNTEFSENGADEYGALGIFSDNILIDYCTFDGNYANKSVGALYFAGDATVNNTIFKRNSAKEWGALFYNGGAGDSLVIDYCQFIDNDCYAVYLYSTHARILNSQFMNSTSEDGFAIYNGAMNELYLSNNTISTDNVEIFTDGGNISSQVTVTILDNKTVYRHLNENVLVYLTFCDDNGNLIQVQGFDLLANNTKINYIYNNLTKRYEANFTSDEIWSYIVTVSDAHLSNLALKNGEIDIVNVTDDFLSLQRLIGNAAGTLTLTKDYIFNPLTDVDFVEGIVINKGIAIDGAGFTIDAKNQARILKVLSDNVTIKNIAFINANSTEGGAIYWETGSNALVSDCNFTNNSAYYGGAIYIEDANLTVNNSHFINSSSDSGCTIFNSINAKLILSNSIFESDCLKGRTIDNNYGILYLHNNTINTQSAEIFNYGGEILSPCTAVIKTTVTTFVLGDKTKFTAVIADDNGNLIEEYYYVYFNAGGKLIESTYDSTKCVYESEYVFDAVGLLKVVVSCPSINITDNFGVDITVLKHDATITANDASYSINYGGKYSITVKDSKGNAVAHEKVTFTLNGKSVGSATTDSKGVATITLAAKTLKTAEAGKKNLVIKLTSSKYNTVAKTVKITINKDKTKIVAKNKEFKKSKKTKKYVMTLKDSKGKAVKSVKVTLNVKGKTFTAKTNSKGKATFKITSLTKKGKFKATIKFKGDDYYKLSTKKVTIKNK